MTFSKTWDHKADRDLFFALITVKKVVNISGADWAEIGAIMRSMGYGFTNEGCRQHFQGIRRTFQKSHAENVATSPASPSAPPTPTDPRAASSTIDPHLDPIARRGRRIQPRMDDDPDNVVSLPPPKPRFKPKAKDEPTTPVSFRHGVAEQPPQTPTHIHVSPSSDMHPVHMSHSSLSELAQPLHQNKRPLADDYMSPNLKRPRPSLHTHSSQDSPYGIVHHASQVPSMHQSPAGHIHRMNIGPGMSHGIEPFSKRIKGDPNPLDDEAVLSLVAADPPPEDTTYPGEF